MTGIKNNSPLDQPAQKHAGAQAPATGVGRETDISEQGFVRFLVHELRNMLAPIRNAAHILRLRGAADANLGPVADIVERQVNGIGHLLNSLAEAERVRRGEVTLEMTVIDLVGVVKSALAASQPLLDSRGQRLHVGVPDSPVRLRADAPRLTQVFESVLENAAKYTQEGGDIRLDVVPAAGGVEVRVRDNGNGMTADVLRRAFEFYADTRRSEQTGKGGLGVSLAIARRLIELHAGRMTAASAGTGQGSEVVVYLPYPNDAENEAAPAGTAAAPGTVAASADAAPAPSRASTPRRILIADDNAAVRVSLSALLQDLGHVVKAAVDGEAALDAAQDWLPEFVFLDVNMPKLSGVEVARQLRSRFPATVMTLVMMSGADLDEPTMRGAKRAGFDHCIDKIGDPRLLAELLRTAPAVPSSGKT